MENKLTLCSPSWWSLECYIVEFIWRSSTSPIVRSKSITCWKLQGNFERWLSLCGYCGRFDRWTVFFFFLLFLFRLIRRWTLVLDIQVAWLTDSESSPPDTSASSSSSPWLTSRPSPTSPSPPESMSRSVAITTVAAAAAAAAAAAVRRVIRGGIVVQCESKSGDQRR